MQLDLLTEQGRGRLPPRTGPCATCPRSAWHRRSGRCATIASVVSPSEMETAGIGVHHVLLRLGEGGRHVGAAVVVTTTTAPGTITSCQAVEVGHDRSSSESNRDTWRKPVIPSAVRSGRPARSRIPGTPARSWLERRRIRVARKVSVRTVRLRRQQARRRTSSVLRPEGSFEGRAE